MLKYKREFLIGMIIGLAIMVPVFFLLNNKYFEIKEQKRVAERVRQDAIKEIEEKDDGGISLLLIGHGGQGHPGGYLADSIILLNALPETKKLAIITIPRDLWVTIPIRSDAKEQAKINKAFAIGYDDTTYPAKMTEHKGEHGPGNLMKDVVGTAVGTQVDYYASVDFGAFEKLVDDLGGIQVDVPFSFTDNFYPVKGLENESCGLSAQQIADAHAKYTGFELEKQFTCRYETLTYTQGATSMSGQDALKYARSRHSANHGSDFDRSIRQLSIIEALFNKLLSLNALKNPDNLYSDITTLVRTDLKLSTLKELINIFSDYEDYEAVKINLSTKNVLNDSKSTAGEYILVTQGNDPQIIVNYINDQLQ